jgi:hypothetical protein
LPQIEIAHFYKQTSQINLIKLNTN